MNLYDNFNNTERKRYILFNEDYYLDSKFDVFSTLNYNQIKILLLSLTDVEITDKKQINDIGYIKYPISLIKPFLDEKYAIEVQFNDLFSICRIEDNITVQVNYKKLINYSNYVKIPLEDLITAQDEMDIYLRLKIYQNIQEEYIELDINKFKDIQRLSTLGVFVNSIVYNNNTITAYFIKDIVINIINMNCKIAYEKYFNDKIKLSQPRYYIVGNENERAIPLHLLLPEDINNNYIVIYSSKNISIFDVVYKTKNKQYKLILPSLWNNKNYYWLFQTKNNNKIKISEDMILNKIKQYERLLNKQIHTLKDIKKNIV